MNLLAKASTETRLKTLLRTLLDMMVMATLTIATGCVTSPEQEIELHGALDEDLDYFKVYNQATSNFEVINNFETRFTIQTTLLSSQFRAAFANRYQRVYGEPQPILNEASQKTGFFVSIYAANEELADISDINLWTIQFKRNEQTLRPIKVEKLKEKERWRPFFTGISPWSNEYLILFDTPAPASGDQDMVYSKQAKLVFSNQDGRVTITW